MPMVYFGNFIKIMGSFVLGDWKVGSSTRTYNNVVFIVDRTNNYLLIYLPVDKRSNLLTYVRKKYARGRMVSERVRLACDKSY